jgi:fructan beta-fructosidase
MVIGYRATGGGGAAFFADRGRTGAFDFAPSASVAHIAPRTAKGSVRMRVAIDVASVELFADDGETVMTQTFFPSSPFDRIEIAAVGGEAQLLRGEIRTLRAAR